MMTKVEQMNSYFILSSAYARLFIKRLTVN